MARRKKKDAALELVDQLLANEKTAPQKKRGRPKGSKKTKTVSITKTAKNDNKRETLFVLQDTYESLGNPKFGYTTARIRQYENKCHGYYEIYLEYIRAAILWSKLAKTIDWFTNLDDKHLARCRKEIEEFKKENGLTKHDFWEVVYISHRFGHSRKKMVKELRDVAKIVLEYRRAKIEDKKEKEKVLFREVAKIPPNVPPILKHVVIKAVTIDATDLSENPQVQNEHACPEHLNYKGLRKPRNGCPTCFYFYQHNKKLGLKEKRNR